MAARSMGAVLLGATLVANLAGPVLADDPTVETVVDGLASPRGIAFGPGDAIYVAEAGVGGDICPFDFAGTGAFCIGLTGAVSRIVDGEVERIVEGLPSGGASSQIGGPSDVAVLEDGDLYVVVNLGGDPAQRERLPERVGELQGWLLRVTPEGDVEPVADISAFEAEANPDSGFPGGGVDSNPHSVAAVGHGAVVVDAGGNSVVQVALDGDVSLVTVLAPFEVEVPADAFAALADSEGLDAAPPSPRASDPEDASEHVRLASVLVQSVPTAVAVGPDGALYVGELTGSPFPVGAASVWRVTLDDAEPTIYARGFSSIIDLAFGPDGDLYVAELVHAGLLPALAGTRPPIGAVLRIPPGGGDPVVVVSDERTMAPGGIAVDATGAIYLTTHTMGEGDGRLVRIEP